MAATASVRVAKLTQKQSCAQNERKINAFWRDQLSLVPNIRYKHEDLNFTYNLETFINE